MRPVKKVSDSLTQQQYLICPAHINHYGRLFGGQLLKWIDELAGIVAIRHCGTTVTTAAIDNLQFQAPAYTGDMIVLEGRVTYVGHSSMEVRVDTFREALDGSREMINRAYMDMVAIDCRGKGVAKALYRYVCLWAKSIGCDFVTLNVWQGNDSAHGFYEAMGLTPRSTTMEQKL